MNETTRRHNGPAPLLTEATREWARIGILSFGGPAAQIALMHKLIVEERGWLSEKQFLNALSFCMLLPGPEAMQIATYAGWRLHGVRGGLVAGGLFVLPGAMILLALVTLYAWYGSTPLVEAMFLGIKASVIAIVVEALIRISKRALGTPLSYSLAFASFLAIFVFAVPYPLVVLVAAALGAWAARLTVADESLRIDVRLGKTVRTASTWLGIWLVPLAALYLATDGGLLAQIGLFFSKLAVVTFGGAYAVLAYMAQDVVGTLGWLEPQEMVDGLGLAETTPGPLILVTQYVGYLAAFKEGGLWYGVAGAGITLWVTFIPCFAWIFTGAPYVDWISNQPKLKGALNGITAAVVGVIAQLSLWFAVHVFFRDVRQIETGPIAMVWPDWSTLDWRVVVLAAASAILLLRLHWNIRAVLVASAVGGLVLSLF
ncbi:MAG: chromate efflux transporter [Ahrensia sp.]|nr:chromate efflux transporter [Ahrensia sp.]